ncbi:MAG: hypothetical protein ACTJLK_04000 [Anaplasma sp.]
MTKETPLSDEDIVSYAASIDAATASDGENTLPTQPKRQAQIMVIPARAKKTSLPLWRRLRDIATMLAIGTVLLVIVTLLCMCAFPHFFSSNSPDLVFDIAQIAIVFIGLVCLIAGAQRSYSSVQEQKQLVSMLVYFVDKKGPVLTRIKYGEEQVASEGAWLYADDKGQLFLKKGGYKNMQGNRSPHPVLVFSDTKDGMEKASSTITALNSTPEEAAIGRYFLSHNLPGNIRIINPKIPTLTSKPLPGGKLSTVRCEFNVEIETTASNLLRTILIRSPDAGLDTKTMFRRYAAMHKSKFGACVIEHVESQSAIDSAHMRHFISSDLVRDIVVCREEFQYLLQNASVLPNGEQPFIRTAIESANSLEAPRDDNGDTGTSRTILSALYALSSTNGDLFSVPSPGNRRKFKKLFFAHEDFRIALIMSAVEAINSQIQAVADRKIQKDEQQILASAPHLCRSMPNLCESVYETLMHLRDMLGDGPGGNLRLPDDALARIADVHTSQNSEPTVQHAVVSVIKNLVSSELRALDHDSILQVSDKAMDLLLRNCENSPLSPFFDSILKPKIIVTRYPIMETSILAMGVSRVKIGGKSRGDQPRTTSIEDSGVSATVSQYHIAGCRIT